jgi:hypothetical protein
MTMIIAHVLPDRRGGFIAADQRWTDVDTSSDGARSYAPRSRDDGGKLLATPLGWASGTTCTSAPFHAAMHGLLAARDWPLNRRLMSTRERVFLLERIVGAELIADGLSIDPGDDASEQDPATARSAVTVALEACTDGLGLFVLNAARGEAVDSYANIPDDRGADAQARLGQALLESLGRAPLDVEARIVTTAQSFSEARSRLKSDAISVGYTSYMTDAFGQVVLRKRFFEGPAVDIAACEPGALFRRFRAACRSHTEKAIAAAVP